VRRRLAAGLLLCLAAFAGIAAAQAVGAGPTSTTQSPTQLWEQFPLDPAPQQARAPASTTRTPAPAPAAAPSGGIDPLVWIVGGALLLGAPLVILAGRLRQSAPAVAQTGTLVPLAPAFRREPEPEPEREEPFEPTGPIRIEDRREPVVVPAPVLPPPEPEPEPEPPEPPTPPAPPARQAIASTYEIVWYRQGERLVFGLQPLDGRATRAGRERSGSFRWDEDDDPPSTLRDAQRAHGRLRSRLLRDGWTAAGRGRAWFSHRLRPPER
jgi:hypothetical protein